MEQFRLDNLAILRDALIANELPFQMGSFFEINGRGINRTLTMDEFEALTQDPKGCGTSACAVGWAPTFIPPTADDFRKDYDGKPGFNHTAFSNNKLIPIEDDWWNWCFASNWYAIDDTRLGAAYRIDVFLKHHEKTPPFNAEYLEEQREDVKKELVFEYTYHRDLWLEEKGLHL